MNRFVKGLAGMCLIGCIVTLVPASQCGAEEKEGAGLKNPFFAMDTGTRDDKHQTPEAQVQMLKELGYAGIGWTAFTDMPALLKALDANGLKLFTVYESLWIEPTETKFNPDLMDGLALLRNRGVILWLTVMSHTYANSSPEGDAKAVEAIRLIADRAAQYGVRVALYPHINSWLERVEDAVRVVQKVDRKNVGATFNLYHWLVKDGPAAMKTLLELAKPCLFVVTINGSSTKGTIETLDRGDFDMAAFLQAVRALGYTGPIGLQGYGIGGDVHENLKRSIEAWRKLGG